MLVYRRLVARLPSSAQHLYFIVTGVLAGWFVIGWDIKHSLAAILATFLILAAAGGTLVSVILSFVFNFGYLLVGYYFTESEGYDICWTMPHCVLALRLIGLTFDCYDGDRGRRLGQDTLSRDQQRTALAELPSLLQMLSHNFYLGGYFIGPQIQMRKFQQFVSPSYSATLPGSPLRYGLARLGLGLAYLLLHLLGSVHLSSDWPASQHFIQLPFLLKLALLPFWCKLVLAKYLSMWLVAEGVCVISGLSFNGVTEDDQGKTVIDWSGCANVKIRRLETSSKFGHVIESFNINTNNWVAVYIYKRLKFLGNRNVSQVVTLVFLAVWHGFHSGYYLVFFNEFLAIKVEREFLSIWSKSAKAARWTATTAGARVASLMGQGYVLVTLPHCFVPFVLLTSNKFIPSYLSMYCCLYVVYFSWPLWRGVLKKYLFNENVPITQRRKSDTVAPGDDEIIKDESEKVTEAVAEKVVTDDAVVDDTAESKSKEISAAVAADDKKNV